MVPHAPIGYGPPMIRHARHHDRISIDPAVMLGKPVIRGTRTTVEQTLREVGAGWSGSPAAVLRVQMVSRPEP